ncbi:hypothetical protein B0H19DRAFT_657490 [Mycena capillaripes]|nr:hypothetical protein B0H19DRAFT_657490 [Mycena capillaripes]
MSMSTWRVAHGGGKTASLIHTTTMDLAPLSVGAVDTISCAAPDGIISQSFVLQLLACRPVVGSIHPPRHRVILSDGAHFLQAVLTSEISEQYISHASQKNTIFGVEKVVWVRSLIIGKCLPVITEMHPIEERSERIGKPVGKVPFTSLIVCIFEGS